MSEKIIKRSGDVDTRMKAGKNFSKAGDLRSEYNACRQAWEKLDEKLFYERQKLQNVSLALETARTNLSQVQEEIDCDPLPEGAQPKARIQQRDLMTLNVAQLEAAFNAQKQAVDKVFDSVNAAEKKLFQADKALDSYIKTMEDAQQALTIQVELDKDRAQRMAKQEEQRAKRWEQEQKNALQSRAAQIEDLYAKGRQQVATAKALHKESTQRLTAALDMTKEVVDDINQTKEAHLADRTEAVLELKTNLNAVRAEVATQADKYVKKVQRARDELEAEKEGMLAKGLNPYIEFRKRDLDAEARSRESRMKNAVEENKTRLAERLVKEEDSRQKQFAEKHRIEAYEKRHRAEQGRALIEKKNAQYITSVTSSGNDILDPTGRAARIDPSQVTDVPDYSVGLGKSSRQPPDTRKRIVEKLRTRLGVDEDDFGEYKRLVEGLLDQVGGTNTAECDDNNKTSGEGQQSQGDGPPSVSKVMGELAELAGENTPSVVPGASIAATQVNLGSSNRAELLQLASEEAGLSMTANLDDGSDSKSPKYKQRTQTKFEEDALARARNSQRQRIEQGVQQVAGGRVFQGDAFVAHPAELLFKDFEVSRSGSGDDGEAKGYKKRFTMTNASYTFNSFKVLDLPDDIIDFFTITYDRPGRVSAGVSCPLDIVFTPQVNRDIISKLRFLTETGPVEVPLTCLIKRCAPRLMDPAVDFGTGVIGQQFSAIVHIKNTQAIGSKFTVHRLEDVPGEIKESGQETVSLENPFDLTDPATSVTDLSRRVRLVLSQVFREKQAQDPYPVSVPVAEGFVPGYGESSVAIRFAPLALGGVDSRFAVVFDQVDESVGCEWGRPTVDEDGQLIRRDQIISVRAVAEDVPIYVADDTVDMKCTLLGRIYRQRLELRNRGRNAYRVNIKIHPLFHRFVEVSPNMLFVQAQSSQTINIKFSPTMDLVRGPQSPQQFTMPLSPEMTNNSSALVMLPIELQVVNQELPVYFILRSEVTSSLLELSTTSLDFGRVVVNQKSILPLQVTNRSLIPQKVAFVRLKKEISIEPNQGFAVLLPGETLTFDVAFSPQSALSYDFSMEIMTSVNDKYVIQIRAESVSCPCEFETQSIIMRTTGPGERVLDSFIVRNTSSSRQVLQIQSPETRYTWIKVSPSVLDLAPGGSSRVEVEFLPPADLQAMDPLVWERDTRPADGQPFFESVETGQGWMFGKSVFGEVQWTTPLKEEESQHGGPETIEDNNNNQDKSGDMDALPEHLPEDEWGVSGIWNFPIFIKSRSRSTAGGSTMTANTNTTTHGDTAKVGDSTVIPMFLRIETAVTLPQIDASTKVLDFGQMALGTRQIKTFKIFNRGYHPIHLTSHPFNAVGPFTMLNAVRAVEPGSSRTIMVECLPVRPGLTVEVLELVPPESVGGHQLRITCKMQGVKPAIELLGLTAPPQGWDRRCGIADFGNVVATDRATLKFSIANHSSFAVETSLVRSVCAGGALTPAKQAEAVDRTLTGLPIFTFRPERVRIAPGSSQVIEVTFRPDQERFQPYREDLEVVVGKTDETLRVGLCGRSWNRQLFVTTGDPLDEPFHQAHNSLCPAVESSTAGHPLLDVRTNALDTLSLLGLALPAKPSLRLEFPDPFAQGVDPSSYVEITDSAVAAPAKGGKGAPPAPTGLVGSRKQSRKLVINSAKFNDGRAGSTNNGTFELVLDKLAVESGLFTVTPDKGPANANSQTVVDIVCTLPKPRGLGGLAVGSWKTYNAQIVLKGGWVPTGTPEEQRLPLELKVFVSL